MKNIEPGLLLEIIVLIIITTEIYSLARHAQLEHQVIEHMKQLDEHISRLNKHPDSSYMHNRDLANEEREK